MFYFEGLPENLNLSNVLLTEVVSITEAVHTGTVKAKWNKKMVWDTIILKRINTDPW